MLKFWRILFFCLGLLFVGKQHAFSAPGQKNLRLVSLAPNLTEIVFTFGLEKSLVGVTNQCDFPLEAKKIDKVGDYGRPVLEAILAKKPTYVLATEGVDKNFVANLEHKKVTVLKFQNRSLKELQESILQLGEKLDAIEDAKKLVTEIEANHQAILKLPPVRKTYVAIIGGVPIFSVNNQTLLAELINLRGFKNLVQTSANYPQLSLEYFLAAKPDVVFVTQGVLQEAKISVQDAAWQKKLLNSLGRGRYTKTPQVIALPSDVFERAGPRIVEAMEFLKTL